jgi:hypothetical protein
MPTTTYKGYAVPTTGTETNTWGSLLNSDSFGVIDKNVGGIVAKTLSSSNVTLSATESEYLILRLTGTLSANVKVTTACQGMTIVENLTSGAFDVTFSNGVGSDITLPQSARSVVITDTTNGPRSAASTDPAVPSGSVMLFYMASAPSGWTKSTANNDKAIRIVSGSGGVTGGSTAFTSVFASRTPAGTVGNTTLDITQIPAHTHNFTQYNAGSNNKSGSNSSTVELGTHTTSTASAGGGASHTHTFTGTAMDFAVAYLDCIVATKD